MSLGICVVGCGRFARTFTSEVVSRASPVSEDGIELFFASRDAGKARTYCRRFRGAGWFGSYEAAASDPRVHGMYLCTPHHLHLEHAALAARSGKHILVEKPIARTLDEGERMIEEAANAGVKLMVAENFRYMPVARIRLIQIQEETHFGDGWRADSETMGGGVLIDGGIHSVAMLIDLGGMPEEVYASSLPRSLEDLSGEDGAVVMARLRHGATGLINHGWAMSRRGRGQWVSISGTTGRIYFETHRPKMTLETEAGISRFRFSDDRRGIGNMVLEFCSSIVDDRPPDDLWRGGAQGPEGGDRGVPVGSQGNPRQAVMRWCRSPR